MVFTPLHIKDMLFKSINCKSKIIIKTTFYFSAKKVLKNRKFALAFVIFKYEDFSKGRAKDKIN